MNKTAINFPVQVFFFLTYAFFFFAYEFIYFEHTPRTGIVGSQSRHLFSFIRNLQESIPRELYHFSFLAVYELFL